MSEAPEKRRPLRLVVGLLVVVAGFYLVISSMLSGGTYFVTVDEAMAQVESLEGRPIRVRGLVGVGTYQHQTGSTVHRFTLEGERAKLPIVYDGPIPDVFAESREVVAEGTLGEDGILVASELTAKCPSKYEDKKVPGPGHPGYQPPKPSGAPPREGV